MKTTRTIIPIGGGRFVPGLAEHGKWRQGDEFQSLGVFYEFLGKDRVGGLHARDRGNQRLVVFEDSRLWKEL